MDEFCHENNFIGWFSTSAKSGMNVKKGMNFMISKIIENKKRFDSRNDMNHRGGNDGNNIDIASRIDQPQRAPSGGCFSCAVSRAN